MSNFYLKPLNETLTITAHLVKLKMEYKDLVFFFLYIWLKIKDSPDKLIRFLIENYTIREIFFSSRMVHCELEILF
jgi:hypothetical protein